MEEKQKYTTPQLIVVTFRVESGFQNSNNSPQLDISSFRLFDEQQSEVRNTASSFEQTDWSW